jgi:hypothetical protein
VNYLIIRRFAEFYQILALLTASDHRRDVKKTLIPIFEPLNLPGQLVRAVTGKC